MPLQFTNMTELIDYLNVLEQRVINLEEENSKLRAIIPAKTEVDGNAIVRYISRVLPQTNIISSNFLKRAFAVWGHFFVANLIIGISFAIIYFCVVVVLFSAIIAPLIHNTPK